jgi:polyribonucleotide nucleotidyltransferase
MKTNSYYTSIYDLSIIMVQPIIQKSFQETVYECTWQGKKLSFKTGKLAPHCDWAVEITMEWTTLLVTAVMEKNPDQNKGRFPLSIDYRESFYAAGKIWWGRYRKREWRPSDEAVLYARLTDRPMRPMFPKWMVNDVIITISPLSLDQEHSPWELSIIGASLATMLAWIPFAWPIWWVRVWYKDWQFLINMTESESIGATMDLHLAWPSGMINMVEAWGNETPIEIIKEWMRLWQTALEEIIAHQQHFLQQCSIQPKEICINLPPADLIDTIKTIITPAMLEQLHGEQEKNEREATYASFEKLLNEQLAEQLADESLWRQAWHIREWLFSVVKWSIRTKTINEGIRVDGRSLDQIRQIYCEIDTASAVHGSWLFWRWDTQVLSLLTLGSPWDAELKDGMEHDQEATRWMHHYKMPPFSNNEAQMIRWTNRREVWHGRLAEKAFEAVLPDEEQFPYTMRVVSEVLWSGWSTSMASVCGTTLALMAWWVPIKKPISGIAMGLMSDGDKQVILTDIMGTEDFTWDMDFKLAWTDAWMTAIQMDTKLTWVRVEKLEEMLDRSQAWRSAILHFMLQTIDTPRSELHPSAPALLQFSVKPEEVRVVIGAGGSTIQEIIRQTDVKIDLEDTGKWVITAKNQADAQKAYELIMATVWSPTPGEHVQWTITRVEKYWVFVDLWNKKTWLCHVKQLWGWFIEDVAALYKVWQTLTVEIIGIDDQGKIQLKNISQA